MVPTRANPLEIARGFYFNSWAGLGGEPTDRLNQGCRLTVDEVQGYYLSLAVFKNILGSAPYQEVLLTPSGHDFCSVSFAGWPMGRTWAMALRRAFLQGCFKKVACVGFEMSRLHTHLKAFANLDIDFPIQSGRRTQNPNPLEIQRPEGWDAGASGSSLNERIAPLRE